MGGRGLHHVTLVASDVGRSCRFYGSLLGLRLAKRTVSHEDPGTYHLCFGDGRGRPGTLITLFPWPRVARGERGACEAWQVALRVPLGALGFWARRLADAGVETRDEVTPFGEPALAFEDPDGALLGLVESSLGGDPGADGWAHPEIGEEVAVKGLHDLVLAVREADPFGGLMRDVLGFAEIARQGRLVRLMAHDGAGGIVTLDEAGPAARGRLGAGSIHHAAFRAADAADEDAMAAAFFARYGIRATAPKDRTYFRSVNFRSTCGILMEIATDGPGFEVDESFASLGRRLTLPAFLEERREELEFLLPPIPPLP